MIGLSPPPSDHINHRAQSIRGLIIHCCDDHMLSRIISPIYTSYCVKRDSNDDRGLREPIRVTRDVSDINYEKVLSKFGRIGETCHIGGGFTFTLSGEESFDNTPMCHEYYIPTSHHLFSMWQPKHGPCIRRFLTLWFPPGSNLMLCLPDAFGCDNSSTATLAIHKYLTSSDKESSTVISISNMNPLANFVAGLIEGSALTNVLVIIPVMDLDLCFGRLMSTR